MGDLNWNPLTWNWYTWGWVILIVAAAALETAAILDPRPHDTFSEHAWALKNSRPFWCWLIVGGLIWFIVHFLTEGKHA